jgi:hypothetical protein
VFIGIGVKEKKGMSTYITAGNNGCPTCDRMEFSALVQQMALKVSLYLKRFFLEAYVRCRAMIREPAERGEASHLPSWTFGNIKQRRNVKGNFVPVRM